MSVYRSSIESSLSIRLPADVVSALLDEYQHIKQQFFLRRYRPSELNAARFSECALRLVEFLDGGTYTALGKQISSENIIKHAENNTNLPEGVRFYIPRLARVLLDVRNKRNVAHVGGEVDPNYSDSLLVSHCADWILIELIRNYHTNSIDEARSIVESINETKIPVIAEVDGFIRVQNTSLSVSDKALLILYYKDPEQVGDTDLIVWLRYSNGSRFRKEILRDLDNKALIHYENGLCTLLPKGILYVEQNIRPELLL